MVVPVQIETILSPHTILRNARPRSLERTRTYVRICPGVPHEQCHPHPDHVAQEISTDRRKSEHGLVLSSSNGNTPSFPTLEDARQLYREWETASATFRISCAHQSISIFAFRQYHKITTNLNLWWIILSMFTQLSQIVRFKNDFNHH